jgi:Protein of unknown function (DUF4232)
MTDAGTVIRGSSLLALAVVLAGCGTSGRASSGGAVPWVNRPRPHYRIPAPKVLRYPTTAPPCRPTQLRVSSGRSGVGTGNLFERLIFKNVGQRSCLLRGYPSITAETPSGRRRLHPRHVNLGLIAANLAPGGRTYLDFGTSDCGCKCVRPHPVRYRQLRFALPNGGRLRTGAWIVVDCWLGMSHFGLPERFANPAARPGTPGTLKARINLPRTVRAGATILYIVTLTNPTDEAVSLRPCPSYTNGLNRSFALNCDTVHAIAPHRHVDYAMRIRIPEKYTRSGIAKVVWSLNTPTGPHTAAAASVEQG